MKRFVTMALIAALHVGAVASILFVQGCRSPFKNSEQSSSIQAAPMTTAPMPPSDASLSAGPSGAFKPTYIPPPVHKPVAVVAGDTHLVQKGESLGLIARQHGVSVADIASLNNIADPNKVRSGQKLKIPSSSSVVKRAPASSAPHVKAAGDSASVYVVQSGDSLSKIAARFGVTTQALRDANNIAGDKLIIGQKLTIPSAAAASAPPAPASPVVAPVSIPVGEPLISTDSAAPSAPPPATPALEGEPASSTPALDDSAAGFSTDLIHVAREGDTLAGIAKLFLVRVEDLAKANGLSESSILTPGQRLRIP